jgi:homoserine O-acetyltransferase/O-succinyltransferase
VNASVRPPASGAWREGDPVGGRQFADVGAVQLEFGGHLPAVRVAYETWGELNARGDNAVLVEHALTGDSHAAGPVGPGHPTPGWWDALIGPGRALDTRRWFVVCPNVLGGCQGTTGPATPDASGKPFGSAWPRVSVRDQVEVERRLARILGIRRFAAVVGGSMGGMRALEWLVTNPDTVASGVLLATAATASADQIATQTAQIQAITADVHWAGGDYYGAGVGEGPHRGLGLARRFAHLTYRTSLELDLRFGRDGQPGEEPLGGAIAGRESSAGRFAVQSYLDHHAGKLQHRFDAGTYVALTDSMTTHDVARGRGSLESVLGGIEVPVSVAGIDTDRLYPLRLQQQLADAIPTCQGLEVVDSPFGHDGFLIEVEPVSRLVEQTLNLVAPASC